MDDMTDGITFERVTRTDLDDIVGLAQAAWYSPDGLGDLAAGTLDEAGLDGDEREVAARLLATDEVASYLAESTWGMKALLDGQVVGIILTQGTHASAEASAYWEGVGSRPARPPSGCLPRPASARSARRSPASPSTSTRPGQQTRCAPRRALRISRACCCSSLARRPAATALGAGCLHGPETTSRATAPSATGSSRTRTATGPSDEHLGLERLAERTGAVRGRARALLRLWRARLEERGGAPTKRRPPLLGPKPELCTSTGSLFENDGLT